MRRLCLGATAALVCLAVLAGCSTTTVSREDQQALRNPTGTTASAPGEMTAPGNTAPVPEATEPSPPATVPEETAGSVTVPETVPATTTSPPAQPTVPPETTAPPKATDPPEATTPPETTASSETTSPPAAQADDPYDISDHQVGALEYEILSGINARRAENGLPPLTMDTSLAAISSVRAYECSVHFSHERPDGRDCFTALEDYGYVWQHAVGENLLYGCGLSAADMVELWMNSDGHRANILSEDFTCAGIGVYVSQGITYVANFFVG